MLVATSLKQLFVLCTFINPQTQLREINWDCVDELVNCKVDDRLCVLRVREEKRKYEEETNDSDD